MRKLLSLIISAIFGLWLATSIVPGVYVAVRPDSNFFGFGLNAIWQIYLVLGIILGLLNYFVKPILNLITLPLRIITLGFFSFIISGALIWIVDVMFKELTAPLVFPLLWTTIVIGIISAITSKILANKD